MRRLALALILCAPACDDDNPVRHLDGGVDSRPIDAPDSTSPVSLTVTIDGVGVAGVKVWFQGPDSSLISSTMTDATGAASAVMAMGGFVTAVDPFATAPGGARFQEVRTFSGVKGGDHLTLKIINGGGTATQVMVTGPVDNDGSVTEYVFMTPCGSWPVASPGSGSSPIATIDLYDYCSLPATDVLIASRNGTGQVVHWGYAGNVTPAAGALDLSGINFASTPTNKTLTYSNIPTSIPTDLFVSQILSSPRGQIQGEYAPTSGGMVTLPMLPFTNALDIVSAEGNSQYSKHTFVDWGPFDAAPAAIDVGARVLPEITSQVTFDQSTHRVAWTETGGQTPDFGYMMISAERTAPTQNWYWAVSAPYSNGAVAFPVLPVEGSVDYNVSATDTVGISYAMLGKAPGGWDAIRADSHNLDLGIRSLATTASGSATAEELLSSAGRRIGPRPRGTAVDGRIALPAWQSKRRM